jgi:hypothetical protein
MIKIMFCKKCNGEIIVDVSTSNSTYRALLDTAHKHSYHAECWRTLDSFKQFLIIKKAGKENV